MTAKSTQISPDRHCSTSDSPIVRRIGWACNIRTVETAIPDSSSHGTALQSTAICQADGETLIALGKQPIPVPEPFASQLNYHLRNRPNLRTTGGAVGTPWLFPSSRPGWHLDPQSIMHRLRWVGINTLGSRNTALKELVAQVPAPLVAEMLGYSDKVTQKHAAEVGNTWAKYVHPPEPRATEQPGLW